MEAAAVLPLPANAWPQPEPGASLLLAFTPPPSSSILQARRTALIIGTGRLASIRSFSCLEAGLRVVILSSSGFTLDPELQSRVQSGQIELLEVAIEEDDDVEEAWKTYLDHVIPQHILDDILLVCITDTIASTTFSSTTTKHRKQRSTSSALSIRNAFYKLRIPVNVADYPSLSDFHFPATHRFPLLPMSSASTSTSTSTSSATSSSSLSPEASSSIAKTASPLQIAITTNAQSCRLASRLRREIVSKLPRGVGSAVARIGELRQRAREIDQQVQDQQAASSSSSSSPSSINSSNAEMSFSLSAKDDIEQGEREEGFSASVLNRPVPQIVATSTSSIPISKCTSPNRMKNNNKQGLLQLVLPPVDPNTGRPMHPSQLPLTPPATPPLRPFAMPDSLNEARAEKTGEMVPPSITRMRFIAQISEYWPIDKLANMTEEEGDRVISLYAKEKEAGKQQALASEGLQDTSTSGLSSQSSASTSNGAVSSSVESSSISKPAGISSVDETTIAPRHDLALTSPSIGTPSKKGKIFLLGSGPGSPALLTMAAHTLLTKHATLILSDKLVPSEILSLIPSSIPLIIAKKFPGNAEGAQNELMDLAYQGALKGEIVVRLKQGDPYVYGRGGEEVLFFRERGFESIVVPGISSAFAAPLMAGIPVTQRGVSESVTVTTGVGRKGKGVKLPGYERSRTLTVLMGVARLEGVVNTLISPEGEEGNGRTGGGRQGAAYPPYCPIAIIEKASSPDQRMVASTLEGIVDAMERAGEQRPPGMMVIGWSVLALEGQGDVEVLDGVEGLGEEELESIDRKRVEKWLGGKGSVVREGLDSSWSDLVALQGDNLPRVQ